MSLNLQPEANHSIYGSNRDLANILRKRGCPNSQHRPSNLDFRHHWVGSEGIEEKRFKKQQKDALAPVPFCVLFFSANSEALRQFT